MSKPAKRTKRTKRQARIIARRNSRPWQVVAPDGTVIAHSGGHK